MVVTQINLVIEEPFQNDADDHEWESVFEHSVEVPLDCKTVRRIFLQATGRQAIRIALTDSWIYTWARQNSPEIDQNSVPRRIQIILVEFSRKPKEEKWVPVSGFTQIECNCGEKGCKAYLIVEREDGSYITAGEQGNIQSVDLPRNIRVCELVE